MTSGRAALPASFRSMTFAGGIRTAAARNPAKAAIRYQGRTVSFAALAARIDALRDAALTQFGLHKGEVAAIVARNCPEYIEVVAGLPEAGVAVATINARLSPPEMQVALQDSKARVVIADAASLDALKAAQLHPAIRLIGLGDDYEALLAAAVTPDALPVIDEWDVWTIPYTSGTTGQPKGVLLSHRSRMLLGLVCASEFGCFGPEDVFLAMTPMNHGGGLGLPAAALAAGGTIEILDRFSPIEVLDRLKNGGITGVFMVPTHFQMIFSLPEAEIAPYRLPPVRTILSNAAPLPQALKQLIIPFFGATVLHELYSSTEAGLVCNLRPQFQLTKDRCVGTPFAHTEVEIRTADGSVCGVDEVGEIFTRSPMLFNGYWGRPQETAEAIRGGWVTVGDLARRDADGFLYIVDRKKDMVISGGVNIYPREIEEVLFGHPAVADVAVVGIPDDRWGEVLHSFIVARDGSDIDVAGIAAFCDGRLTGYKVPKRLTLVESLPRNANGKVLKGELRRMAQAG